jgi:hypothetical protein
MRRLASLRKLEEALSAYFKKVFFSLCNSLAVIYSIQRILVDILFINNNEIVCVTFRLNMFSYKNKFS